MYDRSFDEYDGMLRVVTTTMVQKQAYMEGDILADTILKFTETVETSADLYCVKIGDWEILGKVTGFAPIGETVRSARFEGTNAYVCTAVQMTDPVFFFDLSDPKNITYKDTGTISGFSTSLVNFNNGYLLGIGVSDSASLKVEIYKENDNGVESVCKYEISHVSYSTEYKSYYIDRENQIIGIGVRYWNNEYDGAERSRYVLLEFENGQLKLLLN